MRDERKFHPEIGCCKSVRGKKFIGCYIILAKEIPRFDLPGVTILGYTKDKLKSDLDLPCIKLIYFSSSSRIV